MIPVLNLGRHTRAVSPVRVKTLPKLLKQEFKIKDKKFLICDLMKPCCLD